MIIEEIIWGYDLKLIKRYDVSYRITQCFKCQKYEYINSVCSNTEKCGHCGGSHNTGTYAGPAPRKRCAACQKREHTSWSAECLMRAKEILWAKIVKRALLRLFLILALPLTLKEVFGASASAASAAEEESTRDKEWFTVATKKRKLAGRPLSAVSKVKTINKDAN
jgi:hypothetical protein